MILMVPSLLLTAKATKDLIILFLLKGHVSGASFFLHCAIIATNLVNAWKGAGKHGYAGLFETRAGQ